MLRVAADARDASPVGVLREMVLEALRELGEGRWLPWAALEQYLSTDPARTGPGAPPAPVGGARGGRRRGADGSRAPHRAREPPGAGHRRPRRGRPCRPGASRGSRAIDRSARASPHAARSRALADRRPAVDTTKSKFLDTHVLRLAPSARVHAVIEIAPFVEVGRAAESLDLIVAPQTLARALSAGFEADALRQRIEAIAPLPESLSRTLLQASIVVGRGTFVAGPGFLWVEDDNVREMLRTRRPTAELFVDPSPPAGLIVEAGVDLERLSRRAGPSASRSVAEGQVVRARTVPPPRMTPPKGTPEGHEE